MFKAFTIAFCLSATHSALAQRAAVLSPDFCRALRSVAEGNHDRAQTGAMLPGFTQQQSISGDVFRVESIFNEGNDLQLVPQRVAQCAPNGQWVNSFQPSPDPTKPGWFQAMWGLPNGVNVSMSMQYSPTARNTVNVVSFAMRPPQQLGQSSFTARQSTKPRITAYRFKCPDGHTYQWWSTGMGNQYMVHLRMQGTSQVEDLVPDGRSSENARFRIRMGSGGAGFSLWHLRNGKEINSMSCDDLSPIQIDDY